MTTLGDVVHAAKVTTGAVYHHFRDKKGLFRAVAESIEAEILERIVIATHNVEDPWSQLEIGTSAMLDICCKSDVRKIILLDAPNVIGGSEWRQIELKYGYGAMYQLLTKLRDAGVIRPLPIEVVAPMLLASLIEAANSVAAAKEKPLALRGAKETIAIFLNGLRLR